MHADVSMFRGDLLTKATTDPATVKADSGRVETRGIFVSTEPRHP